MVEQFALLECPSCGYQWTSGDPIEQTDEGWVKFCGLPQVICPQCKGHTDPQDCFVGFFDSACDPMAETLATLNAEMDALAGDDGDPHGRDPEEGTSRPYPWDGEHILSADCPCGPTVVTVAAEETPNDCS